MYPCQSKRIAATARPALPPYAALLVALTLSWGGYGCGNDTAGSSTTSDREPPTLEITGPSDGALVAGLVDVTWRASDNRAVTSIAVFLDDRSIATLESEPQRWTWNTGGIDPGTYQLVLEASDAAGNQTRDSLSLEVTQLCNEDGDCPPQNLRFVSHEEGAAVTGDVEIEVEVDDDNGIENIVFLHEEQSIGEATSAPWTLSWNTENTPEGNRVLTAVATDTAGQKTRAELALNVDRTPPELTVTSPQQDSIAGDTLSVAAQASDNIGLDSILFGVLGTTQSITVSAEPWEGVLDLSPLDSGEYRLLTTATDLVGLTEVDSKAFVLDRPPSISIVTPAQGELIMGQTAVEVEASDDNGVARIEFRVAGEVLGVFSQEGTFAWQPSRGGMEVTFEVVAYDENEQTASALRTVTVAIDPCDRDGDGFRALGDECGGDDCQDEDAESFPGGPDLLGDDFDANCDGHDGIDADGDTYASVDSGGGDCDDNNPEVSPCPGDLPDVCNDRQTDPRNCGACGVRCDVALHCTAGACVCEGECNAGDPEDYDYTAPGTFLSRISIIYDANQGLDLNEDGEPDNAFGPLLQGLSAFLNGDINRELALAISDGSLALGTTWPDLPEEIEDITGISLDAFELVDVDNNPITRNEYYATRASFLPGYITPRARFREGETVERNFRAGPAENFFLTIPLGGAPLNLILHNAEISGRISQSPSGVALSNGRLGGIVEVTEMIDSVNDFLMSDLCDCLGLEGPRVDLRRGLGPEACVGQFATNTCNTVPIEGVCAGIATNCLALMLVLANAPDLDTNGDGEPNAFSAYLRIEGSPTSIVGPAPVPTEE